MTRLIKQLPTSRQSDHWRITTTEEENILNKRARIHHLISLATNFLNNLLYSTLSLVQLW
jgi:hypothetical protein